MAPPILWEPGSARLERATITRYARWLAETRGIETGDYHDLWRWSVTDIEAFWASIWEFFDVQASEPYERVLGSRAMPGAQWFPGARLNYAEHVFRRRDAGAIAIRHASELRPLTETSWGELDAATRRAAASLRAAGVGPGDRVVAYLPNIVEAIVAFHACASLGAIWSSCSPDFGVRSVVDRFAQIEPRVLLAVDGYRYGGRDHDRLDVVRSTPERDADARANRRSPLPRSRAFARGARPRDRLGRVPHRGNRRASLVRAGPVRPSALGPLQLGHDRASEGDRARARRRAPGALKMLHLHVDMHADDRLFWFTTTGWMMWNFLGAGLLTDGSIVLYDGTRPPRPRDALGPRGGGRDHLLRDVRQLRRSLHEGRDRAAGGP